MLETESDMSFDLYNLTGCNYHSIQIPEDEDPTSSIKETILRTASRATQILVEK